ncbi:MAG: ATP-binding protein [Syntrophales bacterium]
MMNGERTGKLSDRLKRYSWLLILLWTGCVVVSLLWNLFEQREKILKIARNTAQITFENDVMYRKWAAKQGGVYVPTSEQTPSNPYLKVPNRDVTTSSGQSLTLVNPAYMARQVNEMAVDIHGSRGHITSLNPIRPENIPDQWEAAALKSFEKGIKEVSSVAKIGDEEYMRLMRPFIAEKACLKCHASQGYKEGDIRGGISVSVQLEPLRAIERPLITRMWLGHLFFWIIGIAGIVIAKTGWEKQILARERAEEVLRKSEERYRSLFNSMTEGFALHEIICNDKGVPCDYRFLDINPAFKELTGLKREEVVGRTVCDILPNNDPYWVDIYGKVALTGEPVHFENYSSAINRHYEVFAYCPAPRQFAVIFTDFTERKRAEDALKERTTELEAANKELESFSYSVSHDLRAPLRAIDGYARMILKKVGDKFDEETMRKFNVIRSNAQMMGQLIDDILTLSRVVKKHLSTSQLEMDAVIREVWKELETINPERNMKLTVQDVPVSYGDRTLIKQVYANLLSNAVKFTKYRDPALIETGGYAEGNENVYYVRDNGVGFEMEYYDKLFGIFQRLHKPDEFEGTGVGLATVERIVQRHGGRVWAEGKVNEGATFYFTLPQKT